MRGVGDSGRDEGEAEGGWRHGGRERVTCRHDLPQEVIHSLGYITARCSQCLLICLCVFETHRRKRLLGLQKLCVCGGGELVRSSEKRGRGEESQEWVKR
jgi:hypothetical protein